MRQTGLVGQEPSIIVDGSIRRTVGEILSDFFTFVLRFGDVCLDWKTRLLRQLAQLGETIAGTRKGKPWCDDGADQLVIRIDLLDMCYRSFGGSKSCPYRRVLVVVWSHSIHTAPSNECALSTMPTYIRQQIGGIHMDRGVVSGYSGLMGQRPSHATTISRASLLDVVFKML